MLLLPLESSCTTWPAMGLPKESRTVTVIVEIAEPSASTPFAGDAMAVVQDDLPTHQPIGRDDPEGILPRVEPGHLNDERTVHLDADPCQHLTDGLVLERHVLGR